MLLFQMKVKKFDKVIFLKVSAILLKFIYNKSDIIIFLYFLKTK